LKLTRPKFLSFPFLPEQKAPDREILADEKPFPKFLAKSSTQNVRGPEEKVGKLSIFVWARNLFDTQ
jgi:hypothetical protein